MWKNSESFYLMELLFLFERQNIQYCIVGNTTGLPDKIHSDIDIIIRPSQIPKVKELLRNFAQNNRIKIAQIIQHEQVAWKYTFSWEEDRLMPNFLHIDFCGDFFRNGHSFIAARELLKGRIKRKSDTNKKMSFYTPKPAEAFIYYLIKKINKQELNNRQKKYLKDEWDKDPVGCKEQIKRFWTEKESKEITRSIETNNWNALETSIPRLKKSFQKKLSFSILHFLKELKRVIQRIMKPTGLLVAFIGPDGSGKSSITQNIIHDLAPAFKKSYVYHLRPQIIFRKEKNSTPVTNPHGKLPRGHLGSFLKILYYFFDYSIGYVLKIWPLVTRSNLVLFDRYYHDILVDPKRFRYGSSTWLAQFIGRIVPKPNLWILLDSPPDILQTRKKETSYEETNRQRKAYIELSKRLNNCIVVDSSAPLNIVVVEVTKAILAFLAKRTEGRLVH